MLRNLECRLTNDWQQEHSNDIGRVLDGILVDFSTGVALHLGLECRCGRWIFNPTTGSGCYFRWWIWHDILSSRVSGVVRHDKQEGCH